LIAETTFHELLHISDAVPVFMCLNPTFEDGLLICLDILDGAGSSDEAQQKIIQVLDVFREVNHRNRSQVIKDQLGVGWRR